VRNITTSSGAESIRIDLHIHSYGTDGSYNVSAIEIQSEKIVDEVQRYKLGIISTTDHNEIFNCQKAVQYSNSNHKPMSLRGASPTVS
jgi:predicted metal-dependent phosphoesterase TrpH